jgi:hypothetical protein
MGRQNNGTPASSGERVRAFLKRRAVLLAVAFVVIASLRIASTYDRLSLTFDEPVHIACGMEYVAKHVYRYESQHPPVSRAMVAIGPYLTGVRPQGIATHMQEGIEEVKASANPVLTVRLMRAGILPFFWLASLIIFLWARKYFGPVVATLATTLFTLLPPVLAHAGLATTDMALTASLPAAIFAVLLWAQTPSWKLTVVMGLACAFTACTKFSALGYLPAAIFLCLAAWLAVEWPGWDELRRLASDRAAKFAAAIAIGVLVIWGVYWFSFGEIHGTGWRVPAPEFFDGIGVAMKHSSDGHPAYLLGENSNLGWWYFFPVAIAVKTPIAFLFLTVVGLVICLKQRRDWRYLAPLAAALGILAAAMNSHVNIGIRHILPIFPMFCLIAAIGLAHLIRRAKSNFTLIACGALIVWLVVSGAVYHPNYLTYFNEFAAGDPEAVLADSDLDWGQDMVALSARLHSAGATTVFTNFGAYFSSRSLYNLPPMQPIDPYHPSLGWNVVSPTADKLIHIQPILVNGLTVESLTEAYRKRTPWWQRTQPTERVGSLKLYYFDAHSSMPE